MDTIKVSFPKENIEFEFNKGHKLSDICTYAGFEIEIPCGGMGTCGKCKIDIEIEGYRRTVLACTTKINANVKVFMENNDNSLSILETSDEKKFHFNPHIKSIIIEHNENSFLSSSDLSTHIQEFFNINIKTISENCFKKFLNLYNLKNDAEIIIHGNEIIDIRKREKANALLGLSIDLGTTSVVGYLYNLVTGEKINVQSVSNMQKIFGLDVISRINRSVKSIADKLRLQQLTVDSINAIINKLTTSSHINHEDIYHIVVCGNSAMQNFLFAYDSKKLAIHPFISQENDLITEKASNLNILSNKCCILYFLPLIGGYVGSDALCVLLTIPSDNTNRLIIDLGTNGELSLGSNNKYYVCSTACGPALEGASISNGMRAETGAISNYEISRNNISYKVIENAKPKGICGSGIIDIVSELLKSGLINKKGQLLSADKLPFHPLKERLGKIGNENIFIVEYAENTFHHKDIYISQNDIRQFQLAKSAILSGCKSLITISSIDLSSIKEILIAGAFGNYINIDNAKNVGLLPFLKDAKIRTIGNAAGTGCQMYMLSKDEKIISNNLLKIIEHIELATDAGFSKEYINNMNFS